MPQDYMFLWKWDSYIWNVHWNSVSPSLCAAETADPVARTSPAPLGRFLTHPWRHSAVILCPFETSLPLPEQQQWIKTHSHVHSEWTWTELLRKNNKRKMWMEDLVQGEPTLRYFMPSLWDQTSTVWITSANWAQQFILELFFFHFVLVKSHPGHNLHFWIEPCCVRRGAEGKLNHHFMLRLNGLQS